MSSFNNSFRIRMTGEAEVSKAVWGLKFAKIKAGGAGLALSSAFFEIWDHENGVRAFYLYFGGGLGLGLNLPGSLTYRGPWNDFNASTPVSVTQFAGAARFTTAGGGNHTVNYLHIIPALDDLKSIYLALDTGFTLGAGGSTTIGGFKLVSGDKEIAFKGP